MGLSGRSAPLRPDRSLRRLAGGRLLVGGSPLRLFRLTAAGQRVADALFSGADLPAGHAGLTDRLLDAGAVHPRPGGDTAWKLGDVTVVTPVYATAAVHLDRPPDVAAMVVVDDASPASVTVGDDVTLVRLPANGGPAAARNVALAHVSTPLVAFVDADVHLGGPWLSALLGHFADDRVTLVAPRVRSAAGPGVVARYEATNSPLDLGSEPGRIAPGSRISYVPGAVMVARAEVIRRLGGFDERLRTGEDVDLEWRLVAAGQRLRYEPEAVVEHQPRPDPRAMVRQRFGYGRSAGPLGVRHGRAIAPVRVNGWSLAVWAAVVARRPLVAAGLVVGTGVALQRKLGDVPRWLPWQLVVRGHLGAGVQLAAAARRVWWPAALAAAMLSRRARWVAAAAHLPLVWRWWTSPRTLAAPAYLAMSMVDDMAHGAGVWVGAWQARCDAPLLPDYRSAR